MLDEDLAPFDVGHEAFADEGVLVAEVDPGPAQEDFEPLGNEMDLEDGVPRRVSRKARGFVIRREQEGGSRGLAVFGREAKHRFFRLERVKSTRYQSDAA